VGGVPAKPIKIIEGRTNQPDRQVFRSARDGNL
jgi:hypothetical protein